MAKVREVYPGIQWNRCIIHKQVLASKVMSNDLNLVLDIDKKFDLWISRILNSNIEIFVKLNLFTKENNIAITEKNKKIIVNHIRSLKQHFEIYFPNLNISVNDWIKSPFNVDSDSQNLSIENNDKLFVLSCDSILKLKFRYVSIENFWIQLDKEYEELSRLAVRYLLPFPYLCETAFSALFSVKTKNKNRLNV
jgi:hypothetical protein